MELGKTKPPRECKIYVKKIDSVSSFVTLFCEWKCVRNVSPGSQEGFCRPRCFQVALHCGAVLLERLRHLQDRKLWCSNNGMFSFRALSVRIATSVLRLSRTPFRNKTRSSAQGNCSAKSLAAMFSLKTKNKRETTKNFESKSNEYGW